MTVLNITNGDSAVHIMKQARIAGEFLPWRDVLHDGPVPEKKTLEALSIIRTEFIISRNWGDPENIRKSFIDRDNKLKSFEKYDKVTLWFEHDLYDQLQILQILDWFYSTPKNRPPLSIICTDNYLGRLSSDEMNHLVKYEEPITTQHLSLSSKAWVAFRSSTPEKWYELLSIDTSVLPFLEGAVIRLLEEFPSTSNGLSRTAQQALSIISEGEIHPIKLFGRYQATEDRVFLGDSSFWVIIQSLLDSNSPLLTLSGGNGHQLSINSGQQLAITPTGKNVLNNRKNWLEIVKPDYWLGGVHLKSGNIWCWNSASQSLSKKAS